MPPLIDQPGVLKFEHLFSVGADLDVSTRIYWTYTGTAPTDAVCADIASAARSAWNNAWLGHLSASRATLGCTVRDLTSPASGYGESLITTDGGASAEDLAASTCLLVNYAIARRYRGGKPRSYWPVMIAADLSSPQEWDAGTLGTMTTEWQTDYLDALAGSSYSGTTLGVQVSISYYEGFTAVENPITGRYKNVSKPRLVAIAPDVVQAFTLNANPGTQRRRQLHSA